MTDLNVRLNIIKIIIADTKQLMGSGATYNFCHGKTEFIIVFNFLDSRYFQDWQARLGCIGGIFADSLSRMGLASTHGDIRECDCQNRLVTESSDRMVRP